MKMSLPLFLTLVMAGCSSIMNKADRSECDRAFYLKNTITGRLYGPLWSAEIPKLEEMYEVLTMPLSRKLTGTNKVAIFKVIWEAEDGRRALSEEELLDSERILGSDKAFLDSFSVSDQGTTRVLEDKGATYAWYVSQISAGVAYLTRSHDNYAALRATYVHSDQLQTHNILSTRITSPVHLRGGDVHELAEKIERLLNVRHGTPITISVERELSRWSSTRPMTLHLVDYRMYDLLEYIREVYSIGYRIERNIIRLYPEVTADEDDDN